MKDVKEKKTIYTEHDILKIPEDIVDKDKELSKKTYKETEDKSQ